MSDGISCVTQDTKTVVIAGMGGLNIVNILSAHPRKTKNLEKIVVDAHRDIALVRSSIVRFGFQINHEKIVFEQGKYYVVIEFVKAITPTFYSEDVLEIGYKIYEDELWPKYKQNLIAENNKTINKIKHLKNMQDKVLYLTKMNERIRNYGKN